MSALSASELTPTGRGAVSVVEVRGPGALEAVRALAPGVNLRPGDLRVAVLRADARELDQALIVVLDETCVELHLHGSPRVVAEVLAQLPSRAPDPAPSSLEERARQRLPEAPCESAARVLLDQAEGALRECIEGLMTAEDATRRAGILELLESARVARYALRPARVLLCGPVNAGKSTLFNALHGADRVLVSEQAGTTRDVVVERVHLGPWPIDLWDTPGERALFSAGDRDSQLELAGLRLARGLAAGAEVLLWLAPAGAPLDPQPPSGDGRLIVIRSLADRAAVRESAQTGPAISVLRDPGGATREVERRFRDLLELPSQPWRKGAAVPFEAAQVALLRGALEAAPEERAGKLQALLEPRQGPEAGRSR